MHGGDVLKHDGFRAEGGGCRARACEIEAIEDGFLDGMSGGRGGAIADVVGEEGDGEGVEVGQTVEIAKGEEEVRRRLARGDILGNIEI